jgi:hypothetical protein
MLVKFLKTVYCPGYRGPGEIVDLDDMTALAMMKEMPDALEMYDPKAEKRVQAEAPPKPLVEPRPATLAPPRMATNLKRG